MHSHVQRGNESKEFQEESLSSWHDKQEVQELHQQLSDFYTNNSKYVGVNSAFEGCYHTMMLRRDFERDFEVTRQQFAHFVLGALQLSFDKKQSICKDWNNIKNSEITQYIHTFQNEKDRANISSVLYDELSRALAHGTIDTMEDIHFLETLSKTNRFKEDWSIFYAMGIAYDNQQAYDQAIEAYEKAIEINPKKDKAYTNMGNAYVHKQAYDQAIEAYQKAIEINPKDDEAYYNMGVAYYNQQAYDQVIEAYEKAIEINPKKDEAYNNMGIAYRHKQEYDQAIEAYQKAIEINPKKDEAYTNMGNAYGKKQAYDQAIEAYQKAIEINPKKDDAYTNMGIAYYHLGELDKVIDSLIKALNINPEDSDVHIALFALQLTQNQPFDQALEVKYGELFRNKKETFIKYEMLKIFQDVVNHKEVNVEAWQQKYHGVGLGGWSWNELDMWIDRMGESEVKTRLLEVLEVFKEH